MMKSHLTLAFALLLVCTGAAVAQTSDGETPAEEAVCDNETGAAFGLCNAYCESMDCESDDPQASETACGKVRDKFTQITGRDLPCQAAPVICPCNDPATNPIFADTVAGVRDIDSCTLSAGTIVVRLAPSTPVNTASADLINGRCGSFFPGMTLPTTPEQSQLCFELLQQAATDQGVTCQ